MLDVWVLVQYRIYYGIQYVISPKSNNLSESTHTGASPFPRIGGGVRV